MSSPLVGEYQGFDVTVDGGIAEIILRRPDRLNALSIPARRDLVEVLSACQLDAAVRVVVLTATGRGFCAGMWLGPRDEDERPTLVPDLPGGHRAPVDLAAQLRTHSQELARTIRRLDKVTIAAVNGFAVQIGLSMALACDYVVAARSATLGSATLRMGYQPDEGGHWLLVEHLGVKGALDFLLRKRMVGAAEAQALGLVTEVVDDDDLPQRSRELAAELAAGPQVAMRLLKRAVYNAAHQTLDQAGDDIAVRTAVSDFHTDAVEGSRAWLRKQTPTFNRWLEEPTDGS
ncbi:enoyl-CoA hydratase/isomerase family protein [Pseudonocardia lacus]|uniref:enoyl-CoA hydratase/isomerase family protein n=1 Tax=Pseudonocardia lacus TaxID=2835865 RepID=UPI001BDBB606|nr:enoyl-CoA hydratase/isomerase family protein [Pseudonocardia lacus]